MSWIQENKFVATLGGVTLAGAVLLIGFGAKSCSDYKSAKERFDTASGEVSQFESLPLYPKEENKNGKEKALREYIQQTEELQAAFEKYRSASDEKISPQEFTDRLKAADTELRKAFEDSKTTLPTSFFVGFESYTGTLARDSATGILDFQLKAVKSILLSLATAAPSELTNISRPKLPEEDGQEFKPAADQVYRALPLEISFRGSEKSVRSFLSALGKNDDKFVVIRSVRIANEKADAPLASDAKFQTTEETPAGDVGGGFVMPGSEEPEQQPAAPVADSSPVLIQVLGKEEVNVFLRLDILQFLPAKPLPKP
ncbi:MAG: Amuc_1100 family pilus-like protein [Luteolibacter sp.]